MLRQEKKGLSTHVRNMPIQTTLSIRNVLSVQQYIFFKESWNSFIKKKKNAVVNIFYIWFPSKKGPTQKEKDLLLPAFQCLQSRTLFRFRIALFVLDSHLATLWESNCPFGFPLVMFLLGSSYFVFLFLSL